MNANIQPVKSSFIESLRNFDFKGIFQNIKDMDLNWMEMATFVVVGIVIGFVCKRYFKSIFFATFIIVAAVIFFEYVGLIVIKWEYIQGMLGSSPMQVVEALCKSAYCTICAHIPSAISFIVGFFISIKVG